MDMKDQSQDLVINWLMHRPPASGGISYYLSTFQGTEENQVNLRAVCRKIENRTWDFRNMKQGCNYTARTFRPKTSSYTGRHNTRIRVRASMPRMGFEPAILTLMFRRSRVVGILEGDYKWCEWLYKFIGKNRSYHL